MAMPGVFIWGCSLGVWGTEIPSGVQGRGPPLGVWRQSPPEAEAVCRQLFTDLTAETGKNSVKVLPQYFAYGTVSWQDN